MVSRAFQPSSRAAFEGSQYVAATSPGRRSRICFGSVVADRLLERCDQLEDADGLPGAEVVDDVARLRLLEGGHVSFGEVDDVDVVAQAGAVGGVVVGAEDADPVELADGDAGDERHQVVRDARGVFTDESARDGRPPG